MSLNEIWKDQADFNKKFFPKPESYEQKCSQTKEFSLCVHSEIDELLKVIKWKIHRRLDIKPNREQVKNELTDILKYWISLCQVWNVSPEEAMQDYWRKSMVCRQRYSEEFILDLKGKIIICDIDGVLADYYTGFLQWLWNNSSVSDYIKTKVKELSLDPEWLDAPSLGVNEQVWQDLKHDFRVSRGKVGIPPYKEAVSFLKHFKPKYKIVLLTSRPIDKYPNLYTDTLEWLKLNNMEFDAIWWAVDKKEMILSKDIRSRIEFIVDDDYKYITQFMSLGIKTYWVDNMNIASRMLLKQNLNIVKNVGGICESYHNE